jgi:hypothetical protein
MKIKKPPVFVRVLLGIVSVLLCVALFVGIFTAMVIGNIRVMTSKDNLQTFFSELLFAVPKKSAPVILRQGIGVGGVRLDEAEAGLPESQQMVVDFLFDMLQEQMGEEMPIDKESVEALLSESTVPEFLSEKMASIMSDVLTGEATTTITADEIVELVEENKTLIEDVIGMEITQEHLDAVTQWVEEADISNTVQEVVKGNLGFKDNAGAQPEGGDLGVVDGSQGSMLGGVLSGQTSLDSVMNGDIQTLLALFREVTSTNVLLTVLGGCAVLILLLFLANYWKLHAALRGVGITSMIASLPFCIPTALVFAVPSLFEVPGLNIVVMLLRLTAVVSFGVFAGGVAMLVGSIVWGSLSKKKARAAALAVEVPVVEEPQI